jgi:hypothetical protein
MLTPNSARAVVTSRTIPKRSWPTTSSNSMSPAVEWSSLRAR